MRIGCQLTAGLALALALAVGASSTRFRRQVAEPESASSTERPVDNEAPATEVPTTITSLATSTAAPTTTPPPPPPPTTSATQKAKQAPVNFTRVDELFWASSEESEVRAKWLRMDKQVRDGVRAILKAVFPHVVSMASDAKVSGTCSGAILKWILNLRNMRSWSVEMLDAIGKPQAGILAGSLTLFGNYKQCLAVRAPDEDEIDLVGEFREYFRGQYCVLELRPSLPPKPSFYSLNSTIEALKRNQKPVQDYERTTYDELADLAMAFNFVSIRADLCVPSLCSRDDIQRVADFLATKMEMRARVQRCQVDRSPDGPHLESTQLAWILVLSILLALVVVSTLSSLVLGLRPRKSSGRLESLVTSMSVYRSLERMRDVNMDSIEDAKPALLYSIRLILLAWLLLAGLASQLNLQFLREMLSLRDLLMSLPLQILVNSSLAFDGLILLTAFTFAYQNINSNLLDLLRYCGVKYARLMPSIMLLVGLTQLLPSFLSQASPVAHDFLEQPARVCNQTGLINLVFLQNWLPYEQICLPQTWLLAVELQLCLIFTPLLYLLNRSFDHQQGRFRLFSWPVLSLISAALLGCLLNFVNVYSHGLPGAWFLTFPDKQDQNRYMSLHLSKTFAHLTTFAVGLFAGHLCRCLSIETFTGRPYGRSACDMLIWLASPVLLLGLVFTTHEWSLSGVSHVEQPVASAMYAALAPFLWASGWSLILFQLVVPDKHNQRSRLANLLAGNTSLVRLGRLSFLAYLLNPFINNLVLGLQEQSIFSSPIMLAHTFIGNLVLTLALALLVSALVELPCRRAFKKFALGPRRKCSNLAVISRQLEICAQNQGNQRDCFTGQVVKPPSGKLDSRAISMDH